MIVIYVNGAESEWEYIYNTGETIQNPDRVTKIVADGPELKQIHDWGYPNHGGNHQWYYGDAARQICANWD
jgi:hypothetical protein